MSHSLNISASKEANWEIGQQKREILCTVFAFLLVGVHFLFLMRYFEPAISTPDASSYFVQAKLLAKEGKTYVQPESPLQYIGPHWKNISDNRYYCTHAPGLPVILALIYRFFGPKAALLVNPLMASLSLLGLFLLCRTWIGPGWGLLAAALMAVNPFANEHALFGDSHAAVCFFLIWGLFFLARWSKTHSPWWAFVTGLFVGIIPTIRYPEILYLPAIGIYFILHLKNDKQFLHSAISGIIGVAIPIGALCIRNQMAFGAFWKTGYTIAVNQTTLFGWTYFARYCVQYLQKLMSEGCALMFGLGVVGISILCSRRNTWKQGLLFALLIVPATLVYMSYFWGPDPQSMRYFLPTFYIYTIAGVWLLCLLTTNHYASALAGSIVLLSITVWWGLPPSLRAMEQLKYQNAVLAQVTTILEKHVEPGSILIANEGINQHLDFIGHWRLVDLWILKPRLPVPPRLFAPNLNIPLPIQGPRNIEARLKYKDLKGNESFNTFSNDVWHWAGENRKVYWLANEEQLNDYKIQLSQHYRLIIIEEIELPGRRLDSMNVPVGLRPPMYSSEEFIARPGPMSGAMPYPPSPQGPNRIFDLILDGKPLFLVEWIRQIP